MEEEMNKITQREFALKHRKCGMCGAALENPNDWGNPHKTNDVTFCKLSDPKCPAWDSEEDKREDSVR